MKSTTSVQTQVLNNTYIHKHQTQIFEKLVVFFPIALVKTNKQTHDARTFWSFRPSPPDLSIPVYKNVHKKKKRELIETIINNGNNYINTLLHIHYCLMTVCSTYNRPTVHLLAAKQEPYKKQQQQKPEKQRSLTLNKKY